MTSVSATWTVPRIRNGSVGWASTWIGVQTFHPARFLQIGVNEGRYVSSVDKRLGLSVPEVPPFAIAFWSDTAHGFYPVDLGGVAPGDVVHVDLTFTHGQWWLTITDPQSALHLRFPTSQERGPMTQAEWNQEDELNPKTGRPFPYPRLSAITIRDMTVNGRAPQTAPQRSGSGYMPVTLTPILHRSFTFRPGR